VPKTNVISAIGVIGLLAIFSGCNPTPTAETTVRDRIELQYGFTVGTAVRHDNLFLISFYDTAAFDLPSTDQRNLANLVAADIVEANTNSLAGISVAFGEDAPRSGVAFNYVYEIRAGVPVFKELLQPAQRSQ